jgi:hypothetical protein
MKYEFFLVKEIKFEPIIGCKHKIIASGATPIGSTYRAPERKYKVKIFIQEQHCKGEKRNFDPIFG